ncbi:MAG: MATE family efflux transporter [Candidatus Binatia bacterium]
MRPEHDVTSDRSEADGKTASEATAAPLDEGDQETHLRPSYVTRDLTKGSIPGNLWFLSWPQIVEASLNVIDQLADLLWAGSLGSLAIAGLGVAQTYTQLVQMVRRGLDLAMRAMIARAVGAGDIQLANHAALQGLTLSIIYLLVLCSGGVVLTDRLLGLIGVSEAVKAEGSLYMRVQYTAIAAMGLRMTGAAMLQSAGDAVTPMKAVVVSRLLHIALGPFLVFGWVWLPSLGLAGLALANLFAQLVGCWMTYDPLFRGDSRLHLKLQGYRLDLPLCWRLLKIGTPACIAQAERGFAQLLLVGFVAPFGDTALAAYSVTKRIEILAHAGNMGFGQASGTLIGQNLGAGHPHRAKQTLAWALTYASVLNTVLGLMVIAFPRPILMLFNQEAELLNVGVVWLQIVGLAFIFMGPSFVFQQSFNIAGDTIGPLVITLIGFWGFQIPLAWLLPRITGLGQFGIAWAIMISMVVRVALFVPYSWLGRWLRVKVI